MTGYALRVNETDEMNALKADEQPNQNIGRKSMWMYKGIHADWSNLREIDFESPHYLWPFGWAGGMQFVSSAKLFLWICGLGSVERARIAEALPLECLSNQLVEFKGNRFWVAVLPLAIWVGWGHAICELWQIIFVDWGALSVHK